MTKLLIGLAAAASFIGGYASPVSYMGATRNLFLGASPVFGPPDGVLTELRKAIEDRDTETLKKLATIEVKADKVDGLEKDLKTTRLELFDLAQKLSEGGAPSSRPGNGKSLGEQFVESPAFKSYAEMNEGERKNVRASFSTKATITSATTDAAGSAGAGMAVSRQPLDLLPRQRLTVRDLLPQVPITTGTVEVPVQKAFTNGAGMVAEGGTKPSSDEQLELKTFNARTIAHWIKASRQIVDDVPQLRGLIDSDLIYGLKLVEESQLLNGDNTGQNLYGMIPQATAYSAPIVISDINKIDVIGLALLQAALANYAGDGIIMHPGDWLEIRLLKDADGNYIFGPPGTVVEPRLFGVPVVPTPSIASKKFLVGEFQRAATIYDRWEARVEVGFVNDDFIKNLITVLGEERLAFAVRRPAALFYGDFDSALSA